MSSFVKAVTRLMERVAPLRLAEQWDNVGLLLESPVPHLSARRVLLTIDLTPAVVSEALSSPKPTSIIIAYHPPIFKPLSSMTLENPLQASLLKCAAHGVSVYSPHTALDSVCNGVNDWLARGLLLTHTSATPGPVGHVIPFGNIVRDADGKVQGATARRVTFETPLTMDELVSRIKEHLRISLVQVAYGNHRTVQTVALCAGSGASVLRGTDADVYWTGEMSHHDVLASIASGKNVILCGHTNTERGYLPLLALGMQNLAPTMEDLEDREILEGMEVVISQGDRSPLTFV